MKSKLAIFSYLLLASGVGLWFTARALAVNYDYTGGGDRFITLDGNSRLCLGQGSWMAPWPSAGSGTISWSAPNSGWHNTALNSSIDSIVTTLNLSFFSDSVYGCANENYMTVDTSYPRSFTVYPAGLYGSFMSIDRSDVGNDEWYHYRHEQGLRSFPTEWTVTGTITD